jgi:hypothetical protein
MGVFVGSEIRRPECSSDADTGNVGAAMGIVAIGIEFRESPVGSMSYFRCLTKSSARYPQVGGGIGIE